MTFQCSSCQIRLYTIFRRKELICGFCFFWAEYDLEEGSSEKNFFRKRDTASAFTAEVKHMVHLRRFPRSDTSLKCEPFLLLKQRSEPVAKEISWEETNSSKNVANRDGLRGKSTNNFENTSQPKTLKQDTQFISVKFCEIWVCSRQ